MDTEYINLFANQGGALLLAGVMIWIMKGWHDSSIKRADERALEQKQEHERELTRIREGAEEQRADKVMLAEIVKANTESNVRLLTVVERIERFIQERVSNGAGK